MLFDDTIQSEAKASFLKNADQSKLQIIHFGSAGFKLRDPRCQRIVVRFQAEIHTLTHKYGENILYTTSFQLIR